MWDKRNDMVVHGEDPYNAEPARHALAQDHITSADTFYSRNHGPVPRIDPDDWRLRVDGLVRTALELSRDDLRTRFEPCTLTATLQCAGNRRAALLDVGAIPGEDPWGPCATSTATWTGVRLADVLAAAGVGDDACHVAFEAPDVSRLAAPPLAYASSIPVSKATASEVLLAWRMNDQDLPMLHGGPVRVVVPGYVGARSVKWVQRVTAQADPSASFFQATAYRLLPVDGEPAPGVGVSLGPVALNSDILIPDDGASIPAGPTRVSGYAYAGDDRGVTRVDVSLDDGRTWVQADLDDRADTWTWRLWHRRLDLPAGRVRITVRAWDTTAATQPESPAHVWNPKGYVNNSWGQVTVTTQA
jgi:sulfite oxidase